MRCRIVGLAALGSALSALALAAPATADLAPGLYQYRSVGATGITEDISMRIDNCGPGCINLFDLETNKDQGQARIQGSQYVLDHWVPGGAFCPDGRAVDVFARYTFNLAARTACTRSTVRTPAVVRARSGRPRSRWCPPDVGTRCVAFR